MFLDSLVKHYLQRNYPGRAFSEVRRVEGDADYLVYEISGIGRDLRILRTARIDPRCASIRPNSDSVRYITSQLDKAFDTRTEFEKLPWQLFSLPG